MSSKRDIAESGYYHVVLKANGRQLLFEDDEDRGAFLDTLDHVTKRFGQEVIAWCLMGNHVHLLLLDNTNKLSSAMQTLCSTYAASYNKKTGHEGHVFRQRFYSTPIESDAYLLQALRYIHDNPEKAGMCKAADWPWSSYHEYVGTPAHTSTTLALELLGGTRGFLTFSSKPEDRGYRYEGDERMSPDEVLHVATEALNGYDPAKLKQCPEAIRLRGLRRLKSAGLSIRQIEMVTGIGRWLVAKLLDLPKGSEPSGR